MDLDAVKAVARWVRAVNPPVDDAAVDEAVSDDAYVTRHHWDDDAPVVERFDNREALLVWLRRSPAKLRFSSVGEPRREHGLWVQAYAVDAEEFRGGGEWRFELDSDGKIRRLQHRPSPLPTS